MTDPFETDEEEWVEISDSTGKRSAMRHLAAISFGGKLYHVLGALKENEQSGEQEHGLMLVREEETSDGAQEYVIASDAQEIENVVGRFVMQSIMKMITGVAQHASEEDEVCPCGIAHAADDFCFCDNPDYLQ